MASLNIEILAEALITEGDVLYSHERESLWKKECTELLNLAR